MNVQGRRVAAFRRRLGAGRASWLIDISTRRTIRVDLTREQQALLSRAARQPVRSLAVMLQSDVRSPVRTALCTLESRRPAARKARRPVPRKARRSKRGTR